MENQRNITIQIPAVNQRSLMPILFGAAIIFFFFTFCEISCGNQRLAAMSGIEMITGTEIKGGEMFGKEFEDILKEKAGKLGKEDAPNDEDTESDAPAKSDKPGNKEVPPNPWAILTILSAIIGLTAYLFRSKFDGLIGGIAGVAGALSLFILQITLINAVKEQGGGFAMIEVNFTIAYWGALLALLIAGTLSFMRMRPKEESILPPPIDFSDSVHNDVPTDGQS